MKIAVSFIKSKYSEIETIKRINETSADYLHVDIMDGKFVENKTYTFKQIKEYIKDNHKPLDIHLMCENPLDYIKDYVTLNPYNITFHKHQLQLTFITPLPLLPLPFSKRNSPTTFPPSFDC